uniref:Uncharacterized protein n=1 Tax=viral metagenome TaxID=1070528 RepID=A0A6C0DZJ9_9ZZZZ
MENSSKMIILIGTLITIIIAIVIIYYFVGGPRTESTKADSNENHMIDVQFSEKNMPSKVYKVMFNRGSPWIGGYELGIGKTYIVESNESKK